MKFKFGRREKPPLTQQPSTHSPFHSLHFSPSPSPSPSLHLPLHLHLPLLTNTHSLITSSRSKASRVITNIRNRLYATRALILPKKKHKSRQQKNKKRRKENKEKKRKKKTHQSRIILTTNITSLRIHLRTIRRTTSRILLRDSICAEAIVSICPTVAVVAVLGVDDLGVKAGLAVGDCGVVGTADLCGFCDERDDYGEVGC